MEQFCPWGTWQWLETLWVVITRGQVLLASIRWKPRLPLNILQFGGQDPPELSSPRCQCCEGREPRFHLSHLFYQQEAERHFREGEAQGLSQWDKTGPHVRAPAPGVVSQQQHICRREGDTGGGDGGVPGLLEPEARPGGGGSSHAAQSSWASWA